MIPVSIPDNFLPLGQQLHKSPIYFILSQFNPVHALAPHFVNISFNITLWHIYV